MLFGVTSQCFTGDILVSTENGLIPIEEIQIGDYVWSENTTTGESELKQVIEVSVTMTNTLVYVTLEDGSKISTTENHPFYVEGKGWCSAAELEVGDQCRRKDGQAEDGDKCHTKDGQAEKAQTGTVVSVEIEETEEPVKVYNLTVEGNHTYYVSGHEVLVHNGCGGPNGKGGSETELFLPDEYYYNLNKNLENGYQSPNTKQIYTRLGNTSHEVETSVVISDEYGRIQYRIDYSTHGNDLAHTNPHIHEFIGNTTKGDYQIQEFRYFIDEITGKMRLGKANNNGTYNWLD